MRPPFRRPHPPVDARVDVEDSGSFMHAVCRTCGWAGPGRRARANAHRDAEAHLATGCPPADVPTVAPVAAG